MSDDSRGLANGRFAHSEDLQRLPAELEPVHELLVAASGEWQDSLPASDRLAAFARSLPNSSIPRTDGAPSNAQPELPRMPAPQPVIPPAAPRRPRPLPAIAAAVAIVALLAGLLVHFAQSRPPNILQQPTATVSSVPTATEGVRPGVNPVTGQWSISSIQEGSLVVSMSNPSVLYHDGKQLERSDNGGKTWRTIQTPRIPVVGATITESNISAMVSTGHSNMLVINLTITLNSQNSTACPPDTRVAYMPVHGGILANAGFGYCEQVFASRDGGTNWQPVQISGSKSYFLTGAPGFTQYLLQQGRQLYGTIMDRATSLQPLGVRIVTSTDGVSWQFADETLRSRAGYVCDYQTAPSGTSLYAIAFSHAKGCLAGVLGAHQIWRSDDGGVHWTPAGSVNNRVAHIVGVTRPISGGMPSVYIGTTDSLTLMGQKAPPFQGWG
jgi:hypothetical protein